MDESWLSAEIMELQNSSQDSNRINLYFIYFFYIVLPEYEFLYLSSVFIYNNYQNLINKM